MRTCSLERTLLGALALSTFGCSWSRFDDVIKDPPVVLLERPSAMKDGFGVSLSTATHETQTEILVGGTNGVSSAALYDIGNEDMPSTASVDSGYCAGDQQACFLSSLTGAFANASGPDKVRPLCFAVGAGTVSGGPVRTGLVVRCQDTTQYALDMPQAAQDLLALAIARNQPHDHPMATDRTDHPLLLASLPDEHLAWFYPPGDTRFSELVLPDAAQAIDPSFGRSLAVLAVAGGRVLALGVSGKSQVLLWKTDASSHSSYIGCLGGMAGLGRALAAGKVDADSNDDLVVSDDSDIHVLDGAALFQLPETASGECGSSLLAQAARLGSFGCGSTGTLTGCETSEFGATLAVGDLDGDGDGEVIVGAPKMTVEDRQNTGALLVYDVETAKDPGFVETKFISSGEDGDELGRSIITPHLAKRDIIAAGAPGNGKAALFYCSALLPHGSAGSRCP